MVRRVTEPLKAADGYWCYNPNGSSVVTPPLPPDGTRYWICTSGGNLAGLGNNITVPNSTNFVCGVYFKPTAITGGNHIIFGFFKDSTVACYVRVSPENGKLSLRSFNYGSGLETVLGDGVNALSSNAWVHVGADYDLHASAGTIRIYRDGVLDITYTGNTGFSQISINNIQVARCMNTVTNTCGVSSFYFNDKTGPAPENTFEGVVDMFQLLPSDDSLISNYIKSTGITAWDLLNNVGPNLTTYIRSSTNGQQQFVKPQLHSLVAPQFIRAVAARWIISKAAGGRVNPGFRFNGSSVINSSDRDVPISPGIVLERKTVNNTGSNIALTDTIEVGLTTVIP